MARTAREVMTVGAARIGEKDTGLGVAKRLAGLGAGARSICGDNDRLGGTLTGRDIVVKRPPKIGQEPGRGHAGRSLA